MSEAAFLHCTSLSTRWRWPVLMKQEKCTEWHLTWVRLCGCYISVCVYAGTHARMHTCMHTHTHTHTHTTLMADETRGWRGKGETVWKYLSWWLQFEGDDWITYFWLCSLNIFSFRICSWKMKPMSYKMFSESDFLVVFQDIFMKSVVWGYPAVLVQVLCAWLSDK